MIDLERWKAYVASCEIAPLFVTVSGAHLYGFPSPDSDVDLRGCHRLPLREIVGLDAAPQTYERSEISYDTEVDLVSHDVGKYFALLVRNNGYVLEQIFSPLVVVGQKFLDHLRPVATRCITRHHYHHYQGFYGSQRKLIEKQQPIRAKAVLYAYRVLLTGIHLLRAGEVEANLPRLAVRYELPFIDDLIASKTAEKAAPAQLDWDLHRAHLGELECELDAAFAACTLPEQPDRSSVNELLIELRVGPKGRSLGLT